MSYDFVVRAPGAGPEPYEHNVTYNLSTMLKRAGFHPHLFDGMTVEQLRRPVEDSMLLMTANAGYFKAFAPKNGWGDVNTALRFLRTLHKYLTDAPDEYVLKVIG